MKKTILSLALLCASVVSFAQMSLTGEIRPRTELYNGANSGLASEDARASVATQQRSRLYFSYSSDDLKIVFTPQLVHFWGQMPQAYDLLGSGAPSTAGPSTFSVYEAYAQYKVSDSYTLKAGRQAISYKDQRWFGALGWAASGRAHDAFVNKFSFGDIKLDVGAALNQTRHENDFNLARQAEIRTGYKSLQYLWLTAPLGDLSIDATITNVTPVAAAIDSSNNPQYKSNLTTIGILPTYKSEDFVINASAYIQTNQANAGIAYLTAFDVTSKALGLPLTLGVDVLSGGSTTADGTNTWAQPFGTNHKFYGFQDFFYVGGSDAPRQAAGLTDIYAKAVVKAGEKSKLIVMPHIFKSTLVSDSDASDGFLGTELDLIYNLNVSSDFNFKLGYSAYFTTQHMENLSGSTDAASVQNWAWMQLTFKPKFL